MLNIPLEQVTTTDCPAGWVIERHLGPVFAHAISGAGLVTEFFAGFSDVFGGRSESLRSRFEEIVSAAELALRNQASKRGGNWLVGFRLDSGEISGKGTMMLRVTVSATAVFARQIEQEPSPKLPDVGARFLPASEAALAVERIRVARQTDPAVLDQGDKVWQVWLRAALPSSASVALSWLRRRTSATVSAEGLQADTKRVAALLQVLPVEVATAAVYESAELTGYFEARPELALLAQLGLVDLVRAVELLGRPDFGSAWWATQSLMFSPRYFKASDIDLLRACESALRALAASVPQPEQSSGVFGIGKRAIWMCPKGHRNELDDQLCRACGRDHRGFESTDTSLAAVISRVSDLAAALAAAL